MLRNETQLPSLEELRTTFIQQGQIPLPTALRIVHDAQELLHPLPNTLQLSAPVIVFGDIHGQFYDLMHFATKTGLEDPHENQQFLFLGDYVDRGAFSCEVMLYLLLLKITFPTHIHLLRGNHECEAISSFYGFRTECQYKYGLSCYYHFVKCFQSMPLAATVKTEYGTFLCLHGGLSPELDTLDDIDKLNRFREPLTSGALCDILWSDPYPEEETSGPVSREEKEKDVLLEQTKEKARLIRWQSNEVRGCSFHYGPLAVFEFLSRNALTSIIRAHELQENGYAYHFTDPQYQDLDLRQNKTIPPVITIFSAPHYCDQHGNMAGYLSITAFQKDFQLNQSNYVVHPAPLFRQNKSSEIESKLKQVFPYVDASAKFFEQIVQVVHHHGPSVKVADKCLKRRSSFTELHPAVMQKALDAAAGQWLVSSEEEGVSFTNHSFSKEEFEVLKLMFSLMDVNGSMALGSEEIHQFITNILGETTDALSVARYLEALDMDRDGVVDFNDLLQCISLLKEKHLHAQARQSSSLVPVLKDDSSRIKNIICGMGTCVLFLWWVFHRRHERLSKAILGRIRSWISFAFSVGLDTVQKRSKVTLVLGMTVAMYHLYKRKPTRVNFK